MIEVKIDGEPENSAQLIKLKNISRYTHFGLRKAWFAVGKDLLNEANRAVLHKPRKGRVYIIRTPSGRRRRHIASRPYESFANRTGRLRKTMQWRVSGPDLRFGYGVANNDVPEYGRILEFGSGRIIKRPTLKNSINANQRNTEQHLLDYVDKEF